MQKMHHPSSTVAVLLQLLVGSLYQGKTSTMKELIVVCLFCLVEVANGAVV